MNQEKPKKAKRIINTITGPWEKRHLPVWAAALPPWINPDHLTILGILSGFIIAGGYILCRFSRWWLLLSNAGLFIHWYADSLDGTLARIRHQERENYGYFVDHMSDAWTTLVLCISLGFSTLMQLDTALFIAVGYLLMMVYAHVSAYTQRNFTLSYGRLGPTEVRIVIAVLNCILIFWNPVIYRNGLQVRTFLDAAGFIVACIFILIFIVVGIRDAVKLDRLDRAQRQE
jgi:archaetidylinositol phosphate synthase